MHVYGHADMARTAYVQAPNASTHPGTRPLTNAGTPMPDFDLVAVVPKGGVAFRVSVSYEIGLPTGVSQGFPSGTLCLHAVVVQGKCQGILFRDYVSRRLVFDAPNSSMPHGHHSSYGP